MLSNGDRDLKGLVVGGEFSGLVADQVDLPAKFLKRFIYANMQTGKQVVLLRNSRCGWVGKLKTALLQGKMMRVMERRDEFFFCPAYLFPC